MRAFVTRRTPGLAWHRLAFALMGALLNGAAVRADAPALRHELEAIAARCDGKLGIAVIHVESGREVMLHGRELLPLYSVFKLPLAVVVLKQVELGRLQLDQSVLVDAGDVAPGIQANTERWAQLPMQVELERLLQLSLVESDNTSSDKLLELVHGPKALTSRVRALGFANIEIVSSTKDMQRFREHPNRASAQALARLLATLQRGGVLAATQLELLQGWMRSSQVGIRRLRGALPPDVVVADKTGTGMSGTATNDVGLITLPEQRGHLAVAVLISGSKLPQAEQERLIADIGRAAYDEHTR